MPQFNIWSDQTHLNSVDLTSNETLKWDHSNGSKWGVFYYYYGVVDDAVQGVFYTFESGKETFKVVQCTDVKVVGG